MAIFADSNRVSIRLIAESTAAWGVTPTTGATRTLRLTSSSLMANKETETSNELRSDRMVSSIIETAASSEGDIEFEFSTGTYDELIQAFLLGQWTRPMLNDRISGLTVSWAANNQIVISGGDFTPYFPAGRRVATGGFLNPANNSYWQISTSVFGSGVTTITMTTSTAVIEVGNTKGFIQDANDIVILKNTGIRAGTAGASSFDSNGTNAFASAISAGQLVVGQLISVEGFGVETGSIDLTATNAVDGDFVTISDGVETLAFEFDNNSLVTSPRVAVTIGGASADSATNLAAAINSQRVAGNIRVSATASGTVVTIRNQNKTGGSITETTASATVVAFSGGSAVSKVYEITALTDDVISVSPSPATTVAGAAVTIKASMLRNPSGQGVLPHQLIVPQSFTLETSFNDVGEHLVQNGMRVGEFSLNVEAGEIVTGSFSFQGKESKISTVAKLSQAPYTPLDTTTTEVLNATTNVGTLFSGGVELSTAIQSIELNGDASLRIQSAVGSKFPRGIGTGRFTLEGTLTAYFENADLYRDFLNHSTSSLRIPFTDIDGNSMYITVPALKLTSNAPAPEGIDEDIIQEIDFTAFRDPATKTMLQLDRFSTGLAATA